MPKLVIKFPFEGKTLRTKKNPAKSDKNKVTSKERVRKHREKLRTDPSLKKKLEENYAKKKLENKVYRQKVKELRKQNPQYDEEIKSKERLRKQKLRKKSAEQKDKQKTEPKTKNTSSRADQKKKQTRNVQKASTTRKRAERARNVLPTDSEGWAEVVTHIINNATPTRKSMLNVVSESRSETIDTLIGVNKVGRPKKNNEKVKKQLAFSEMTNLWKSSKSHEQYISRKKKQVKRLSKPAQYKASWKAKIEQFLVDNSRIMPNKKDTVLINKAPVAKRHLLCSKFQLYKNFKRLHPNFDRKFITFYKMIPKNYKKLDLTCRRVCICTKDYNLDQKVEALNKTAKQKAMPELQATSRQLSNITVCPFLDRPARACVDRKCNSCGTNSIKTMYTPLLEKCSDTDIVKYHQWESVPETYTNKEGKCVTSKRWIQTQKTATSEDLVDDVIGDMESFTAHLFRADFQHMVETQIMTNLPLDHCVAVMDFSENISLQQQDEIESAHWTTKQVTLHPIYIVRHAADSTDDMQSLMKESLVIISDSLAHTSEAVYVYTNQLMLHLKANPGPCDIKVLHRFSDNCAVQYKCKQAFGHISMIEESHGIKLIYHFTESGHGKGPSDGLGGAIKARLQRMILGGKVINNAYEVYLALVQTQNPTLNQRVIYIPQRKLKKDMPMKDQDLKTVKGTHTFHMVSTKHGEPGVLECRDLSCSCMVCIGGHEGPCFLSRYRHALETRVLVNRKPAENHDQRADSVTNHGKGLVDSSDLEQSIQQSVEDHTNHIAQHTSNMFVYSNSIAKKGWKIRGQTPEDGNCCFWAISDQLDRVGVLNTSQFQLRQNVVQYIADLSEGAKAEMEKFMTTPIQSYLQTMSKDGTYADHICLQAMSKMLSAKIRVVHSDIDDVILSPTDACTRYLVLGYLPEMEHYVSLQPLRRFEAGDFVAVALSQRRRRHLYIAKVLQVDGDEVELRFLQSSRPDGVYTWPNNDDISWQPQADVLQKLTPPNLAPGRGLKLKFDINEIKLCQNNL